MATEGSDPSAAIRAGSAQDWPAIGRLLGRSPLETASLRQDLERGYDPLLTLVVEGPDRLTGAVVAGVPPGGFAGERGSAPECRVLWIEVAPAARRQGTGSRLLQALLAELTERRYSRVAVLLDGGQFEAQRLFEKHGFRQERQTLGLVLPAEAGRRLAGAPPGPATSAVLRPLSVGDVPLLAGLLIHLGVERAGDPWEDATDEGARGPHDDLPALSPAQLTEWLQRAGTVGYGAWERSDPGAPLGLAWASRRREDGLLRFIGVHDDSRRRGVGTALVGALVEALAPPAGPADYLVPLRAQLNDPTREQDFFRALGFQAERVTRQLARAL